MKRVSIYLLYVLFAWGAFVVYDYYVNEADWLNFYRKDFSVRADKLNIEGLLARSFWEARPGKDSELLDFLEARRSGRVINFWAILDHTKADSRGLEGVSLQPSTFDFTAPGTHVFHNGNLFYATENLGPERQLVLGLKYDEKAFLQSEHDSQFYFLLKYCIGIGILSLGIFAYFFRDVMRSIRQLLNGGRRSYARINANSREADMLVRGFAAYDEKTEKLQQEKDLFSWQVLPSLRTEITSGRTPPYDFACTLVRTDINNFSKIYNENPVEEFAQTINDFFTDVSHAVSRYGGLVHEFVGDEVIYYFKDEDVGDSVAAALSACRDIGEIAARYNKFTLRERGYPFTVKSSFAHGRLRFGRFVNGYGLAGPSLIETVRVLSQVTEKDGNVIVFDDRHLPATEATVEAEFHSEVRLKGFQEEKRLMICRNHRPIEEFLEAPDKKKFEMLRYFRNDDDIAAILRWARVQDTAAGFIKVSRLVGFMREFQVTASNGVPQQLLMLWIEELTTELESSDAPFYEEKIRILSSALRLVEMLVPKNEFTHRYSELIQKAMKLKDRRVVANALEALTVFRKDYEPELSGRLAKHPDNRVAANALVHEGIRSLDSHVVKRLQKMLSSRQPTTVASALYALGEIASHHRNHDIVYYNTHVDFTRLVQEIPKYAFHEHVSVRTQALKAAAKSADPVVVRSIWNASIREENAAHIEAVRARLGAFFPSAADWIGKKAA